MKSVNPYLNFQGNTEEAFNFYKKVFGGEFPGGIIRFNSAKMGEKLSEEEQQKVMHVGLPMGNQNYLMATDALESLEQKVKFGNNFYIAIDAESKDEADMLFEGLSDGGKVEMPMADQFWGDYFGSLTDQFGVQWMVIYSHLKTEN
ncbi:MAG: VOC family protein [Melioribacteraceae bacterium]|nr:VOC family protein [Melioribacteraceae bacterium]MCF8353684.1 VOC family protein [Melioribacteraceae bacterium]MCF8394466.1 VOC family protein [Melioribacteraceae bacterium]MCF8418600.1 VOC family protein [Melioribacteraceae bacterium]